MATWYCNHAHCALAVLQAGGSVLYNSLWSDEVSQLDGDQARYLRCRIVILLPPNRK